MRVRRTSIVGVPAAASASASAALAGDGGDKGADVQSINDISSSCTGFNRNDHEEQQQQQLDGDDSNHSHGSRRSMMRARRTSIVGVPAAAAAAAGAAGDGGETITNSSIPNDISSQAGSDDDDIETTFSRRTERRRVRRTSIVGISGGAIVDVSLSHSARRMEGQGTVKPVKSHKSHNGAKTSSVTINHSKSRASTVRSSSLSASEKNGAARGCLKASSLLERGKIPKCVRFGHLVIQEFPIILGE